jgi:hypothetical protein
VAAAARHGQVENDMVLDTSAYRNGIRVTSFTRSDRGIGYPVGATDANRGKYESGLISISCVAHVRT